MIFDYLLAPFYSLSVTTFGVKGKSMMTIDEQKRAVWEWMGVDLNKWYCPQSNSATSIHFSTFRVTYWERHDEMQGENGVRLHQDGPDLDSLDVIAEVEKKLINQFTTQAEAYWRLLGYVQPHPIFATAPQRLEALCRTLWPERWQS